MIAARFTFTICLLVSLSALTGCIAPDGTRFQPAELLEARRGATRQPDQDHMTQDRSREQGAAAAPRSTSDRSGATGPFPARPILYFTWANDYIRIQGINNDGRLLEPTFDGFLLGWNRQGDRFAYMAVDPMITTAHLAISSLNEPPQYVMEFGDHNPFFPMGRQSIWSPDGTKLALILGDPIDDSAYDLVIFEIETRHIVNRIPLPSAAYSRDGFPPDWPPYTLKWSPQGDKVLLAWEQTIVIDVVTGVIDLLVDEPAVAEWMPTGDGIIFAYAFDVAELYHKSLNVNHATVLFSHTTFAELGLESSTPLPTLLLRISPSGKYLAISGTTGDDAVLLVFDLQAESPDYWAAPWARLEMENVRFMALEWGPTEGELALLHQAFYTSRRAGVSLDLYQITNGDFRTLIETMTITNADDLLTLQIANLLSWTP